MRQHAAASLGDIGDLRAVDALIGAMTDREDRVRGAIVAALGKIGGAKARRAVEAALKDKAVEVRRAAEAALEHIDGDPGQKQKLHK